MSQGNAIDPLFRAMFDAKASDLHLCVGSPPIVRKDGHMQPLDPAAAPLTGEGLIQLLARSRPERTGPDLKERKDTDSGSEIRGRARFAGKVSAAGRGLAGVSA